MTTRILQVDEWRSLSADARLIPVVGALPDDAVLLAVYDDEGEIVGTWAAFQRWHVEGVYIVPEHRHGPGVARRLLAGMSRLLTSVGASTAITFANRRAVRLLIAKLGGRKVPGSCYVLPVGD